MRLKVYLAMNEDSNLVVDVGIVEEGSPIRALQEGQEEHLRMITANYANDWIDATLCKAVVLRRLLADKKLSCVAEDIQRITTITTKEDAAQYLGCDWGEKYKEMYSEPSQLPKSAAAEILAVQLIGEWNQAFRPGFILAYLQEGANA